MSGPLRLFIVDDHEDVRRALTARLNSAPDMVVIGDTADAEDSLLKTRTLRPDGVLVETKRADGRGLEIVSWIAQSGIEARVIVLTSYPSEWERWAAHRAGAARYLLKDIGSPLLIDQIRGAAPHHAFHDYAHPQMTLEPRSPCAGPMPGDGVGLYQKLQRSPSPRPVRLFCCACSPCAFGL